MYNRMGISHVWVGEKKKKKMTTAFVAKAVEMQTPQLQPSSIVHRAFSLLSSLLSFSFSLFSINTTPCHAHTMRSLGQSEATMKSTEAKDLAKKQALPSAHCLCTHDVHKMNGKHDLLLRRRLA
jgi:hypothetical protein